ncbi:uncharacterized protein LOC126657108 isoform X2 [Mercurialis annua]|uniref:uncharacterized protein LOC126657108 isoform X2 n=1 Tax=Mercurialis annua TaxID=3986 RepID=UPI0024ACBF81|nr:uncharacterized protein LOC126657108 isoform X2 [Mercurialis annua]
MDFVESNQHFRGRGKNKRSWTAEEDAVLIESLQQVATEPKYKQGNTWKNGYLLRAEELMNIRLPSCGLRANPHIDSRWKTMKTKYNAIAEMLNKSGFAWDDSRKMVQCEKSVFEEWCQNHRDAKGLWGVSFPLFHEIGELVGKDRATGKNVEILKKLSQIWKMRQIIKQIQLMKIMKKMIYQ